MLRKNKKLKWGLVVWLGTKPVTASIQSTHYQNVCWRFYPHQVRCAQPGDADRCLQGHHKAGAVGHHEGRPW